MIESDCLYDVNLVNNVLDSTTHYYASLIGLCRLDLASFTTSRLVHYLREGNVVADKLVQLEVYGFYYF